MEVVALARRLRDARSVLEELVRRYGDVVRVRFGPATFFLLAHPDDVERVLETEADRFERVAGERRVSARVVGRALFSTEGPRHAWERSMLEPVMYGPAAELSADAVVELTARWRESLRPGEPLDVWAAMETFCTELIVRLLTGLDPAGEGGAIVDALRSTVDAMDRLPAPPTRLPEWIPPVQRRFRTERARLDELLRDVIAERRRERGDDLLSRLIDVHDGAGRALDDRELRDALVTLYRGHTATSTALALTWWRLGGEPAVERRLLEEVDALDRRPLGYADLDRLDHTRRVFQESLRLYPPAWVLARTAVAEHRAGPHTIRPGSRVLVSEWVTHRDPRFWDDPLAFRPERFTEEATAGRPRYAYFPQGGGDKLCMGRELVVPMEAPLVLATVAQRVRLRPIPGRDPDLAPRATLKPTNGVWLVPELR
ncbi:MAG TPA: cytochrome P450 [Actinomycetota bacterium]